MPTVLRDGPFGLFFFSNENNEPPHIHVERDDSHVKFWLDPVSLAGSTGFRSREINVLHNIVEANLDRFVRS